MVIGERLKELRKQEPISQGDVEKRTGLLRCYISRVENGHTVPSVDTLWKDDPALEVPMYRIFTDEAPIRTRGFCFTWLRRWRIALKMSLSVAC